jgi:hypothetical protein
MSLRTATVRRSFAMAMMVLGATLTSGQNAWDLVNGKVGAGSHTVKWNAERAASGVYFAVFTAFDGAGVLRFRTVNKLPVIK